MDSWGSFPQGCRDGRAAAACISQGVVIWMDFGGEKELQVQPRIRPAWQRVASLFFGCSRGNEL